MGRRATSAAVVVWIAALAAAAGCTRRNEGYCCTDPALCGDVGEVLQDCPSGQLCDDTGDTGRLPHTCYPDPNAASCRGPDDCGGDTPACVDGICVECDDDLHCEDPGEPRCDLDLHRCARCEGHADCERFDGAMTCDLDTGRCVECAAEDPPHESAACDAGEPVCGADGMCRGCEDHRECASGACDTGTGACVAPDQIAYVDAAAPAGNADCTATDPCPRVALGLATMRPYVVLDADTFMEDVVVDTRTVTIVGHGATLRAATNGAAAVRVTGATGRVALIGATITASDAGAACEGTSSTATLALELDDVLVENSDLEGVRAYRCDLAVRRSRITGNDAVGVMITQAGYDITNTIIDGNGPDQYGGVRIESPRPGGRFAFNTVSGNQSPAAAASGISCYSATTPLPAFHSNIVHGNTGGTVFVDGAPNCTHAYSLFPSQVIGTGNEVGDPQFTIAFRIGATSPARDRGDAANAVADDIDRQPRSDGLPDIGADEYVP